jgi:hypothetical protein
MRSRGSLGALVAAALTAAVDVFYLLLISGQEDTGVGDSRVLFVAGCLAAAAICTAIGALIPDGLLRVVLLAASGCALLAWTFLGIFSIGLLLLLPTILTLRSAAQAAAAVADESSYGVAAAAGFAALAFVAIGLAST